MVRKCDGPVRRSGVRGEGPTCAVIIVLSLVFAAMPTAQQVPAPVPDLEGGWVRIDVDGSGSLNALAAKFPRALLKPAAQAAVAEQARRAAQPRFDFARDPSKPRPPGEGYVVTDGNCTLPGGVEPNSSAFHIVQSRDQVLAVSTVPS